MASNFISIVVPLFNNLELTKRFLKSLYETASEPIELILVNNNSSDGTKEYIENLPYDFDTTTIINNETNEGFAKAVNKGIKQSKYPNIMVINNDITFLQRNWMTIVCDNLSGIVGLEKLYSEGVDFVTGAFMAFKKELYDKLGGFDERFFFAYEDVDFCYRSQIMGYPIIHLPLPMKHDYNRPKSDIVKKYHDESKQKFIDKWKEFNSDKKIVHLVNQLTVGGVENVILNIQKFGKHNLFVMSPKYGLMAEELNKAGANVFIRSYNDILTSLNTMKPDIIHCHTNGGFVPVGVNFPIVPKPKVITTIHNPAAYQMSTEDVRVSVSKTVASMAQNTTTIINGIDIDKYKTPSKNIQKIKDYYGFNKPIVGRIGRLCSEKNIVDSILVAERLQEYDFVIVGNSSDDYLQKCQRFVKDLKLDNVYFLLEQRDNLYQLFDVFLYPSMYEGVGLVFLEAMVNKIPVVTYNFGVAREIINNNVNGYLVEPHSINGLCNAVKKAMNKETTENGYMTVLNNYDAKRMAKEYNDLYDKLLEVK